jgi:hypothetical protein
LQTEQNKKEIDDMYYSAQIIKSFLDNLNNLIDFCVEGGDEKHNDENFSQKWKKIENNFFYNNDGKPKTNEYEQLTSSLRIKLYDILEYLENNKMPKGSLRSQYKIDTGIINIKSDDIDKLKIYYWLFNNIYRYNKERIDILNLIKYYIYDDGILTIKKIFKNRLPIEGETPQTEILTRRNNLKPLPPLLRNQDVRNDVVVNSQGGAKKKKDSKVVAKRVPTPYNRFVKKHFPELKKKFPNDKAPEIMK